jgi:hypothetical protein
MDFFIADGAYGDNRHKEGIKKRPSLYSHIANGTGNNNPKKQYDNA